MTTGVVDGGGTTSSIEIDEYVTSVPEIYGHG